MKKKTNSTVISIFIFLVLMHVANAQEKNYGALVTDRPDATEAPSVVPKGYIQIETGGRYEENEEGDIKIKSTIYNTTLIRYGLLDNLELRLGGDFVEEAMEIAGNKLEDISSGYSPLLLGVKLAIAAENGFLPEIGLIGHFDLPFSSGSDYRPETTGVNFRFSFAHTLSEKSSFAYNLGAKWEDDSPEAIYEYTIAYGYAITSKFGAYAELYGELPEDSGPTHNWDAGLTYLVRDNIQLDATIGSAINGTQQLLLSGGLSFRLPN